MSQRETSGGLTFGARHPEKPEVAAATHSEQVGLCLHMIQHWTIGEHGAECRAKILYLAFKEERFVRAE